MSRQHRTTLVGRKNAYTRFTVLSIVQCLLAYADQQFSRGSAESTAQALTLYETAVNLLNLPELQPEAGAPFPDNPVWTLLGIRAQSSLAKIHNGLNIAGILAAPSTGDSTTVFLPSQYRYQVLVDRAKNLVNMAEQVEASFLAALEKRDAENYSLLQANNGIEVAASSVTLADLKVADAGIGVTEAQLQKNRADVQFNEYNNRINNGLNFYEDATLAALGTAAALRTANAFNPKDFVFFKEASNLAEAASAIAQLSQAKEATSEWKRTGVFKGISRMWTVKSVTRKFKTRKPNNRSRNRNGSWQGFNWNKQLRYSISWPINSLTQNCSIG